MSETTETAEVVTDSKERAFKVSTAVNLGFGAIRNARWQVWAYRDGNIETDPATEQIEVEAVTTDFPANVTLDSIIDGLGRDEAGDIIEGWSVTLAEARFGRRMIPRDCLVVRYAGAVLTERAVLQASEALVNYGLGA